jgi:hypothetical protein
LNGTFLALKKSIYCLENMYKYPVFLQNERMMKKQSLSSGAENHIAVVQETTIRRTCHNEE